jgi:outer membrane biosynthesis protein TonB
MGAATASVILHLLLMLLTWNAQFGGEGAPATALANEDFIELTLLPEAEPPAEDPAQPKEYTAVPERLATEEPPDDPDYLALYHSIAADRVEGGDDSAPPAAEEESEFEKVAIRKEDLDGAGGVVYNPQTLPPEASSPAPPAALESEETQQRGAEASTLGEEALAEANQDGSEQPGEAETEAENPTQTEWLSGGAPSILKEGQQGARGDRGFEFDQMAVGKIEGNAVVTGNYSLNTYEWEFAPWMHRFEQDLRRHWFAPYAYALGVIDGRTVVRFTVELDGVLSATEVIHSEGHESLHQASMAALKASAPYAPLPANFPEENLVITLTLLYPPLRY